MGRNSIIYRDIERVFRIARDKISTKINEYNLAVSNRSSQQELYSIEDELTELDILLCDLNQYGKPRIFFNIEVLERDFFYEVPMNNPFLEKITIFFVLLPERSSVFETITINEIFTRLHVGHIKLDIEDITDKVVDDITLSVNSFVSNFRNKVRSYFRMRDTLEETYGLYKERVEELSCVVDLPRFPIEEVVNEIQTYKEDMKFIFNDPIYKEIHNLVLQIRKLQIGKYITGVSV